MISPHLRLGRGRVGTVGRGEASARRSAAGVVNRVGGPQMQKEGSIRADLGVADEHDSLVRRIPHTALREPMSFGQHRLATRSRRSVGLGQGRPAGFGWVTSGDRYLLGMQISERIRAAGTGALDSDLTTDPGRWQLSQHLPVAGDSCRELPVAERLSVRIGDRRGVGRRRRLSIGRSSAAGRIGAVVRAASPATSSTSQWPGFLGKSGVELEDSFCSREGVVVRSSASVRVGHPG